MTGDPRRDDRATSHHFGGTDEPIEDEYAEHQRRQADRFDGGYTERCTYVGGCNDNRCLLDAGHDGDHLMQHESEDT